MIPVRSTIVRALREPMSKRARRELGYCLLSIPVTVLGLAYVLVSFVLGAGLAVTAAGVPLIAFTVTGARRLGALRRRMAARYLDEHVAAPPPLTRQPRLLTRMSSRLRDGAGWHAIGYLLAVVPLTFVGAYVVIVTWAWGLINLTYPMQYVLGINLSTLRDSNGVVHQGFVFNGVVYDTWPRQLLVSLAGIALLLIAPWAVRALLLVDRLLIRALLGPPGTAARIRDLEHSRAYAIDDVAATLRRIERDLHDGVQARMVAVAMNLTMLNETLGTDTTPDSRRQLTAARDHAKDALAELRDMVGSIHPPALDGGLETALTTLAARSPIPVDLHAELSDRPTPAIETIAYFSAAELLTNATKHSGANRITIDVTEISGRLKLEITDNGHGGARTDTAGTGLLGLTQRVGTVDGRLTITSPPDGPTVITVDLPLHT
ncbi:MAG TPA: sensor domain-containing protein [Pseudonocardiaceae bacterium]